ACYAIEVVGDYLYVSTPDGIYRSLDDGDTWKLLSFGQPLAPVEYFFPINNTLYGSTNKGLYRSDNYGDTWSLVGVFPINAQVLTSLQLNNAVYVGTYEAGCAFKTIDNGYSWQNCSGGMSVENITSISGIHDNVFAGSYDGLFYYSSNSGDSWNAPKPTIGQSSIDDICVLNDSSALIAQFEMRSTTNKGQTWKLLVDNTYISCFCRMGDKIYCGAEGVYRSTNQGAAWELLPNLHNVRVNSITTDGSSLVIGTDTNGVLRSIDEGEHWMALSNEPGSEIRSVLFVDSVLYATVTDNYTANIVRTSDFGDTWTTITDGYNTQLYSSPFLNHVIFAFGEGVVGLSFDRGDRWNNISDGLPSRSVTSLYVSDHYVYAAIFNRGLWRKLLSEIFQFDGLKQPTATKECSVYPNPSNSFTRISLHQSEDEFVQIKIIDLLGNIVAIPYSGKLNEGDHSFDWNAATVPSGIYHCIVQRNGSIEALPIIVSH
ncbi:MAG TPA: T9SS type A sorting domain-containing protein, partial [Candidatus Kapabacteria bacterium]|nr:T9SS type A sorting domain-containing protein [Candidatus Kapabacteria bacterium]